MKKTLKYLLVICLLFCTFAVIASAEKYGGECGAIGDNVTWSLDTDTGVFEISGTGAVMDYDMFSGSPWRYYTSSIKSVTVAKGVTRIGAFFSCENLTSVTIPDSVTGIGRSAFQDCKNLTDINIPDSVTSIGQDAFKGCTKLQNTVDNLIYIKATNNPYFYLYGTVDKSITSCTINGETRFIGSNALSFCDNLTSVTIPDSVTSIEWYAFCYCDGLASITIPDSVISIGGYAFDRCSSLANITIPDSVTSISDSAFSGCSSLASITIPNSVTSIGSSAFSGCSSLTSIIIPDSVTSIGSSAFSDCSSLASITIPDCITNIRNSTFNGCSSLTSIAIPYSVTIIGSSAFSGCSSLTSITIPDCITTIKSSTFKDCSSLTSITIPDSVVSIGDDAFGNCSSLANITIPDGVVSIGNGAFYGCTNLTDITIPDSVTSIGSCFLDCEKLQNKVGDLIYIKTTDNPYFYLYGTVDTAITSCIINEKTKVIGNGVFYGCSSLSSITIPDGVVSIGNDAFYGCTNLTDITIPDSVVSMGDAFRGCEKLENKVGDLIYIKTVDNPCFYLKYANQEIESCTVDEKTKFIGNRVFDNCRNLTSVILPDGLLGIGDGTFRYCVNLTSITIPESVKSIGIEAFRSCILLKNITIPNNVIIIKDMTFLYCSQLNNVTMSNNVITIGEKAFMGCSLAGITIPESVKSIDDNAFSWWGFPMIYCVRDSYAHKYAVDNGIAVAFTDEIQIKMTIGQSNGYIDGVAKPLDAAPIIRESRTMLPVRFVAEALGATVGWDGATSTAIIKTADVEIKITIGAKVAYVNGKEVALDAPAFIESSRTYMPVRFVAEALGATVSWDGATSTATLTKKR